MTTSTDTLYERLAALAGDLSFANYREHTSEAHLQAFAERAALLAEELREGYVPASTDGDVPTNAQGIALARFLRPCFRQEDKGYRFASVSRGGAGLGEDYIFIRLSDGYEGGIDRDGRTST